MNNVAKQIFDQLGGNVFAAMTGAKQFVQDTYSLQFKIGGGTKNKANLVRVTLEPSDTYKVEFFSQRGTKCTPKGEFDDVYCDQLATTFTAATGFYTKF